MFNLDLLHVEQGLLALPEHLISPPDISWVRIARCLVFCVVFYKSLFVLFPLAIVLSVLLLFIDSHYPLGVYKLLLDLIESDRFL